MEQLHNKNVYFFSDAHLGSWAIPDPRGQERRLVRFLDSIKERAAAVYILGDLFDFWHEYRYVVPKGYTRLLGKISELTDSGIDVHFFIGNHDLWCGDYLQKECGVVLHREALDTEILGQRFYLAHGDGLDATDRQYLFLRSMFHNKVCQKLFASVHPRWGMYFGLAWARQSRQKHAGVEGYFNGPEHDGMMRFVQHYLAAHPDVHYFVFGHRHVDVDLPLSERARLVVLGDWIQKFSYATFDGSTLTVGHFSE